MIFNVFQVYLALSFFSEAGIGILIENVKWSFHQAEVPAQLPFKLNTGATLQLPAPLPSGCPDISNSKNNKKEKRRNRDGEGVCNCVYNVVDNHCYLYCSG